MISAVNNQAEAICAPVVSPYTAVPLSPHREPHVAHPSSADVLLSLPPQIVAAILAIAGIVMMTYADGFHSHSVIGITFVVASASMSALYKVFVCV